MSYLSLFYPFFSVFFPSQVSTINTHELCVVRAF